ncbi:MAG: hypothetical protein ACTSPD_21925, partial [Promethearchaeota archaeon]
MPYILKYEIIDDNTLFIDYLLEELIKYDPDNNDLYEFYKKTYNESINQISYGEFIKLIQAFGYNVINLDKSFTIENYLTQLIKYESLLYYTNKRYKDHMIHACRIAIIGDKLLTQDNFALIDWILEVAKDDKCIIKKYLKINEKGKNEEDIIKEKRAELRKIWFIASILHDIGYLFETYRSILKSLEFFNNIPKIKQFLNQISNIEYNCLPFPKFEHGDLSDLFIKHLSEETHPSLTYAGLIAKNHSSLNKFEFFKDPLSSLLIILDEFQEWNRPVVNIESIDQFLKSPLREEQGKDLLTKDKEYENGLFSLNKKDKEIKLRLGLLLNNKPSNLLYFKLPLVLFDKSKILSRINLNNKSNESEYKFDLRFFILVPP